MKQLLLLAFVSGLLLVGCAEKPIESYNVTFPDANSISVDFELAQKYSFQMDGDFDIMEYGSLFFDPPTEEKGLVFGATVNTGAFIPENWLDYEPTNLLPTGEVLPSFLGGESLIKVGVPAADNEYVTPYIYFGIENDYWIGTALQLDVLGANYPKGLSISQTFYNDSDEVLVGGSVYGPQYVDGVMTVPGGLFIAVNISNCIRYNAYSEAGLNIGFDRGGISRRQLRKITKRIVKDLRKIQ